MIPTAQEGHECAVSIQWAKQFNHKARGYHSVQYFDQGGFKADMVERTHLSDEREHMTCDVSLGESSTSIREEVLPFALESLIIGAIFEGRVVFRNEILRQVRFQAPSPFSQGAGVVWRDNSIRRFVQANMSVPNTYALRDSLPPQV